MVGPDWTEDMDMILSGGGESYLVCGYIVRR